MKVYIDQGFFNKWDREEVATLMAKLGGRWCGRDECVKSYRHKNFIYLGRDKTLTYSENLVKDRTGKKVNLAQLRNLVALKENPKDVKKSFAGRQDEKVIIEVTLAELLKAGFIMGSVNGSNTGKTVYEHSHDIFGESLSGIRDRYTVSFNYNSLQGTIEEEVFMKESISRNEIRKKALLKNIQELQLEYDTIKEESL